ncbi:MAG TPA: MFS transporter [Acidimicrobiales bacterium]|nr:MFS transporter [Acidimicrobiales bacterium]
MWLGRFTSSIGDGVVFVAFPLIATRLTHNPVLISGVAFATTLPWLLFALPAGALADRVSRRRLVTVIEAARMVALAALGVAMIFGRLSIVELYCAAFLVALFETAFDSATNAVIPQVATGADLVHANSRLQFAQLSGEQFIGPAIGGFAVAVAASTPVLLDAVSFAFSGLLLAVALRPARRLGRHGPAPKDDFALVEPPSKPRASFLTQIRDGLAWLLRAPTMRLLCTLNMGLAFCQALGLAVVVIYATRVLHLSPAGFGVFTAVAASGNAIGAWMAPRVHASLGSGRTLMSAGILGGVALFVVGTTTSTGVAVLALGAEAIAVGVGRVAIAALRQQLVPLELAGRVSAAVRSSVVGAAAIAALLGGGLVAAMGPQAPFVLGGLAQIVIAVLLGGALARRLAADRHRVVDLTDEVDLREQPVAVE